MVKRRLALAGVNSALAMALGSGTMHVEASSTMGDSP